MSRTAHHTRTTHTSRTPTAEDRSRPGGPWHAVVLYDLRFEAGGRAAAGREGRRAVPRRVRRAVAVFAFPRYQRDASVGRWAAVEERRARQRLRARVGTVIKLVNSAPAIEAADAVDIPPARHRRGALWWA
ncbi:hypothetical protein [Streptomyces laurentii]|uniref:hypothetical protein n=1 Tax=Streptomyces laurentii TaxID=39478 RepID=UPI0036C26CA1